MTLKKFCFGAAVLLSLAASSAFADDAPDCTSPQTQADMTICAGKDYEKADKQLNAAYQKVRKQLAERDKTADESGKGAVDALVAAQRAWWRFAMPIVMPSGFRRVAARWSRCWFPHAWPI